MFQFIMETNTLFSAMAVLGILGAASQIFLGRVYTGLWKDAARGGQAQGKLMKRIRQRAGASPNPVLLVESSLMEYRTMGQSLHGWQRTGLFAAAGALLLGAAGWYLMRFQHLGRASVLAQQYLIFGAAAAAVVGVVHVLADIQYKKRNLETRMLDYLENICQISGRTGNAETVGAGAGSGVIEAAAAAEHDKKKEKEETKSRFMPAARDRQLKLKESKAEKDKRELKENLTRLKEGLSESAAAREKERNTEILKQMEPGEQERVIREVLKEFLS